MIMDLSDLYQEIILDHNKHPRNAHDMSDATHSAEGYNPLCGDEIKVYLKLEGDRVVDISFKGEGCAISKASASLMTERLKGKTLAELGKESAFVLDLLSAEEEPELDLGEVGDLAALSGVRQFPARIKCATLAWHAVDAALAGEDKISTE
ncbi:MAG TPA: SUF system NifU family Fe-S cluster assembly protein [Opitutae bacterium]|nr:SUF system NifU family Fe-S cluster assembly protein [Opitutae bacterium]|tara:strand:- start:352 stop:804 length:453 start_codon:yes stop_codon:yes gene_type:complete